LANAAPDLIDGIDMQALLADKGFDNNHLRDLLQETETKVVIPPKADRKQPIACDFAMYRWRHLIENFFCNLKQFRGIATRYDKTDESFAAFFFLRATHLALK
jgi:transposase